VGLYKLCEHKGRARDRCEHIWWARYRHVRVSLEKWSNREIETKTEAEAIFDDLKKAVRAGTFEKRRAAAERKTTALTFRQFADIYKERHVFAKKLAIGKTIDYRLKPIIEYFDDRPLVEIRTADVEDFISDLRKPRLAGRRKTPRVLAPASINRTIELLRHMMNWAVGREYIDRTPFRRGTETLVRKLREDNQRRRRIAEDEEARLLAVAPPLLRSMIIAALDTGMRLGEMLALRFKDVDFARGPDHVARRNNEEAKNAPGPDRDREAAGSLGMAPARRQSREEAGRRSRVQRRERRARWQVQDRVGYRCAEGERRRAGLEVLQLDGAHTGLPRRDREPPGRSGPPRTRRDIRSEPTRAGRSVNLSSFSSRVRPLGSRTRTSIASARRPLTPTLIRI
jgi:hypothetical protein